MNKVKIIPVCDFKNEFEENAPLTIDVRTEKEFQSFHLKGAVNMPLMDMESFEIKALADMRPSPDKPVYFLCHSGKRAETAAKLMAKKLDLPILVIEGGSVACEEADMPIVRGQGVISLERQVRIAAGGLVALGVAFGAMIHPGFYGISAFVGCGLMFAGITDTCAMGMALSKMPWNEA